MNDHPKDISPWKLWGLTLLIILNAALAFGLVWRAKSIEAPARACALEKWRWIGALEKFEWNFRRWEMLAPSCLKYGLPVIKKNEDTGAYLVQEFESSQIVIENSPLNRVKIPSSHTFTPGRHLWLCMEGMPWQVMLDTWVPSSSGYALLTLVANEADVILEIPKGTWIVQALEKEYRSTARKDGNGFTVMAKSDQTSQEPIFSGITSFSASSFSADEGNRTDIAVDIEAGSCQLHRFFSLFIPQAEAAQGRWLLSRESLEFQPWLMTGKAGMP